MMVILKATYILINLTLIFFLLFRLASILISRFFKEPVFKTAQRQYDFACIITAYKNLDITVPLVDSFLRQQYNNFIIYLVADDCHGEEFHIENERLILLRPESKLGSKVKSMIHAVDHFKRDHDCILILDPDNVAKHNFLSELNKYFNAGFKAVQGKRTAKNLDSVYACLDAAGELYYNFADRLTPFILKSSSSIAGSGMAVDTKVFKTYLLSDKIREPLERGDVIPAEDSILQDFLVRNQIRIAFSKNAILYDEKVDTGEKVERQRTRWIFSYFENLQYAISSIFNGFFNFDWNRFYFGLNTSYPPLFLLVLSSFLFTILNIWLLPGFAIALGSALVLFFMNFLLVLKLANAPSQVWRSIWAAPAFVGRQVLALFSINKARKDFLPTQHTHKVNIDEVNEENS